MDELVLGLALATPLVQSLLMGVIGYPLARRRPGGMERFHRSGFQWWIIGLLVVLAIGAALAPDALSLGSPSQHDDLTAPRVLITLVAGLGLLLAIETAGEFWQTKTTSAAARAGRERYENALPESVARTAPGEGALVGFVAVLEEAVYRGLALGSLLAVTNDSKPLAAGIVAIGFGAAHWYFGARQVLLKMLIGSVLCAVALSAGWATAAATHLVFNLVLVAWARRAKPT